MATQNNKKKGNRRMLNEEKYRLDKPWINNGNNKKKKM